MPELAMVEVFAWPLLAAGFAWFFLGRRAALAAAPAAFALLVAALWFASPPGGGNRAMLARMGEAALWAVALGIPAFFYARVVAKARRAARERDE
ncbi:hypothetical protein ACQ5SO_06805 [Rhodovulum sp. DZ06]|uniref:hypothetical protein n=1 Tax=Rhodovulum sp. DZ06 TaxID=3425126 RepID=UPI003D359B01